MNLIIKILYQVIIFMIEILDLQENYGKEIEKLSEKVEFNF